MSSATLSHNNLDHTMQNTNGSNFAVSGLFISVFLILFTANWHV